MYKGKHGMNVHEVQFNKSILDVRWWQLYFDIFFLNEVEYVVFRRWPDPCHRQFPTSLFLVQAGSLRLMALTIRLRRFDHRFASSYSGDVDR